MMATHSICDALGSRRLNWHSAYSDPIKRLDQYVSSPGSW